ncbi:unnamed protein product [Phaedon cochleariae]|uniref:Chromatin modification-related protein YNG2 n=1 Tax=Phaedon cochleariae TaxID=80249 RepID=A0A9P0DHQ2_PHACE|nr:unnamed protein product [Phaedon cochleariae]
MENGSNSPLLDTELFDNTENGVGSPIMVKTLDGGNDTAEAEDTDKDEPNEETSYFETTKVNGDNVTDNNNIEDNNSYYSSESDALVIDESVPKKSKKLRNKQQKIQVTRNEDQLEENREIVTHSNPFFNESLFELSQLHQTPEEEELSNDTIAEGTSDGRLNNKKAKGKPKPKLREYAQYLGLQPTVQFKCSKCGRAGFESLSTLQEHVLECNEENVQESSAENSCSGFKLTRKVFLCSACGTYYENWNLYMHMLEFHRRFICLYCLGMFSILEDLCQHIQSRHNLQPGHKNTLDEFFNVYNEPCYVVCCECNKLFSEQDNFFYHNCVGKVKNKKLVKQQITPENHVTGESESVPENNSKETVEKSDDISMNNNIGDDNKLPESIAMETSENITEFNNGAHDSERDCQNLENNENSLNCDTNHIAKLIEEKNIEESDNLDPSVDHSEHEEDTEEIETTDMKDLEAEYSPKSHSISDTEEIQEEVENNNKEMESVIDIPVETRKVPKLSLKIPKFESYPEPDPYESEDSDKLTMEVDQIESENEETEHLNEGEVVINNIPTPELENESTEAEEPMKEEQNEIASNEPHSQIAGPDIPVIELELEQPLDKFDPCVLLQKCLQMTVSTCIYCNHARKIAVNGRQLGLHCIAEHRFSAVVNSITAEELIPMSFVNRINESLMELEAKFFSLETNFSGEAVTFSHLFECFQCHFSTNVHKELYLHNRKFHSKNLLLCIMCKSNFYSYSELICHLCPGQYILDYDIKFRCCMCVNDDLPSSFRLMVHLRKRHNVCDVCLEMCHTQYRLSNHVWKHKLHHFCYRCGIAYRNKPDITRHLFWKHGTESVLCKKCLQKKWPHVYHFCVPPASFTCDECSLIFTKAVSLKVHKRIHGEEKKWRCTFDGCQDGFVSRKLMEKHEKRHYEPLEEVPVADEKMEKDEEEVKEEQVESETAEIGADAEKPEEKPKQMIDVLDLPALNLSESDSSDSEPEVDRPKTQEEETSIPIVHDTEIDPPGDLPPLDILQEDVKQYVDEDSAVLHPDGPSEEENPSAVIQTIWDNFKSYQQSKQKLDMFLDTDKAEQDNVENVEDIPVPIVEELTTETALRDHDYCVELEKKDTTLVEVKPALNESIDHDYCFAKSEGTIAEKPPLEPITKPPDNPELAPNAGHTKGHSSSSSTDSDSSSCSCGSNCSCSSSSGSSSSSSDSSNSDSSTEEGRKKQLARRAKRKERAKKLKAAAAVKETTATTKVENLVDVVATDTSPVIIEPPIRESDLDTTESETDEEFYDEAPQKIAKKILDEKRQQLLELMGPNSVPDGGFIESTSRPPTPPAGVVEEEERKKKKSKSKKKKKRKSERKDQERHADRSAITTAASIISPDIPIPPYYQQFHQQLQLNQQPTIPTAIPTTDVAATPPSPMAQTPKGAQKGAGRRDDSSLRASKRRRVPNKFYGYSSDEEQEKDRPHHVAKWRKVETPQTPRSPMVVPPITLKTTVAAPPPAQTPPATPKAPPKQKAPPRPAPQPTVEPISIRTAAHLSDFRVRKPRPRPSIPAIRLVGKLGGGGEDDSEDSNDSSEEEEVPPAPKPAQPQLYCYCQCPYDEVSEMIGCDATDCAIEWFHFECVGIMVPPKGQWYCPDCRKKKARRELMQTMRNN